MYNSYEEYMQSVLGVRPEATYGIPDNMPYFEPRAEDMNLQEVNMLYPEIYRIVYPMVQKACGMRSIAIINEAQINEIVEEVYTAVETDETQTGSRDDTRNGDVKNPRAKETRRPANNSWLRDLIRILILRELLPGHGGPRQTTFPWGTTGEDRHMAHGMPGPGRTSVEDRLCQDLGGPRRQTTYYAFSDTWECIKKQIST